MIEKLERYIREEDGVKISCPPDNVHIISKINELCDAVNGILDYAPLEMAMKAERSENVQDEFAEQRKWIGKLCKFRDDETDKPVIGVLKDIDVFVGDNDALYISFLNATDNQTYFECEPVKLDDNIIYKKEKYEIPAENVQQISYMGNGDITVFHGFNCSVEFDTPLPKGIRITIREPITKGGNNE